MIRARITIVSAFATLVLFVYSLVIVLWMPGSEPNNFSFQGVLQLSFGPMERAAVPTSKTLFTIRRYTLAVEYWEQLTQGTLNLLSLAHLAQDWGARTIVPFTRNSFLFGLPESDRRKLDALFNISEMNTNLFCEKYNTPPLADFEEFMKMADRSVVYVYVAWTYQSDWKGTNCLRRNQSIDCGQHSRAQKFGSRVLKTLNTEADRMHVKKFSITSFCCINPLTVLSTGDIAETCNFTDTNSTLIFNAWRGHINRIEKKSLRFMFPGTQTPGRPSLDNMLPCTEDILSNATAFTQSFSHGKEFIAFHFRTGLIGTRGKKYTDKCMKEAFVLRQNLTKTNPEIPITYFVDYGEFGTTGGIEKELVIPYMKRVKIIPPHYNPEEFGGLRDNGFVSLVEKSAIANARILVLVGRGYFQAELALRMQAEPTSERIYYVCRDNPPNTWSVDVQH